MPETNKICNKKGSFFMRDVKGGGKSSNPNPNVLFLHVVQILFLIPFQVTKMNVNPSNVLQIIILTTGVKRCPP